MLPLITAISIAAAQQPASPPPAFDLVKDGVPACAIVTADRPRPAAQLAALELQYHLLRITGAEVPIHRDSDPVQGRRVLVGESAATRQLGLRSADFKLSAGTQDRPRVGRIENSKPAILR
jgi:hypothetical protein